MDRRHRPGVSVAWLLAICVMVQTGTGVARAGQGSSSLSAPAARWTARFDGRAHRDDGAAGVVVANGGTTVVVAGTSEGARSGRDIATVAYDAETGALLWTARFDGSAHRNDSAVDVTASPDGRTVFVTGSTVSDVTHSDFVTIAYDVMTGAVVWTRLLDGSTHGRDTASAVRVTPDGSTVFVTGTTRLGQMSEYLTTEAYAASTGFPLWQASYGGPDPFGVMYEQAAALAVSPAGDVIYVTGQGYIPAGDLDSGWAVDVIAYRATTGAQVWQARPVGGSCVYPSPASIAVSPDAMTVVVTGRYDEGCNETFPGYFTVALGAADGVGRWGAGDNDLEAWTTGATAVAFTPDGRRVVQTGNLVTPRYGTVAYAPGDGTVEWSAKYDAGGPAFAWDVEASPDSREIFVTGVSRSRSGGYDFASLAYRAADGEVSWSARYDDPLHGSDGAVALAVGPDGRTVFVTGWADGDGSGSDFLTISYPTA